MEFKIFYFLFLFIFALVVFFVWQKWKEILSFFMPYKFFSIYFLNYDNNLENWLFFRKDLSSRQIKIGNDVYLFNDKWFTDNKLKAYFFIEGIVDAQDIRNKAESSINPATLRSFTETTITGLFEGGEKGIMAFIKEYGILILIILAIIIIFIVLKQPAPTPAGS